MSQSDHFAHGAWRMLEDLYLDSESINAKREYSELSETERRATLLAFANRQAVSSTRWARIASGIRAIELIES
jgi:hypothetical protein